MLSCLRKRGGDFEMVKWSANFTTGCWGGRRGIIRCAEEEEDEEVMEEEVEEEVQAATTLLAR